MSTENWEWIFLCRKSSLLHSCEGELSFDNAAQNLLYRWIFCVNINNRKQSPYLLNFYFVKCMSERVYLTALF